jgi:MFS family permease
VRRPSFDAVRGFDRAVYVVALGQLINVFGSGLVYPFATVHFHLRLGIALSMVGLGLGAKSVGTAAATALGGYLADRYARKPVMVASMALCAFSLSAFAFVPALAAAVPGLSLAWAFVAVATVSGLTTGLYTPAAQAMTADLTEGPERDEGYAMLKMANNTGLGAGFVVGGLLYEVASVAVFVADGLTSGVVAVFLFVLVERTHGGQRDVALSDSVGAWGRAVSRPRIVWLALLNVGFAVMYAQMKTTVPVVAKETLGLDAAQLGTLYVLNPLTIVLLQIPIVASIAHWRRTRGLVVSTAFWAVSMAVIWPAGTVPRLLGLMFVGGHLVLRTVGEIIHSPLSTSLMSSLGTSAERGSQLSILEVAKRLGMGLGAFVGGVFFDYGYADLLWPVLVAVCGLIAVGLLGLERRVSTAENGAVPAD